MRQLLCAVAAVALCAAVVGCGSPTSKSTGSPTQAAQVAPQTKPDPWARRTQPILKGMETKVAKVDPPKGDPLPPDPAQFDADLVRRLNELRAKANQTPLSFNPMLTRVAQEHAKLMAKGKKVDANPAKPLPDQVIEAGYKFKALGVNRAGLLQLNANTIYDAMITAQRLGEQLVKPEYNDIGIGVDFDGASTYYVAIIYAGEQK